VFNALDFGDLIPATIKVSFFCHRISAALKAIIVKGTAGLV
jgi:hypothetical protein